ncbi:MAG: AmmeMemoRadiSam system protein B [Polyangiaceae bacterium]|nr:AmmeMemoRadiSam system protein B [Polyangiaceae bacterium]MCE7888500.1 AmmeMemoRadiSam system protein B [Sorangiineae bacterium PRO1]MCL4751483.1 AmmeMemoRadiSam system protein B [Myxococcales bacterium]
MLTRAREPAVAGRFYPGDPRRLDAEVRGFLADRPGEPRVARMLMAPHAGYVYSGAIAGETYARVTVPAAAVVLCPNHTGFGDRRSLWNGGSWSFPGFTLDIDAELRRRLLCSGSLHPDELAHVREHAAEVQMPFLHALRSDVRVVPICLGGLGLSECREIGLDIASAIREHEREQDERVLLVASTDMSHYVPADTARHFDQHAIDRVLALDPEGLFEVCEREDISMCGYLPTTVSLFAARELGATRAELVRYGSSGEVSGDFSQVVGYAGVIVY